MGPRALQLKSYRRPSPSQLSLLAGRPAERASSGFAPVTRSGATAGTGSGPVYVTVARSPAPWRPWPEILAGSQPSERARQGRADQQSQDPKGTESCYPPRPYHLLLGTTVQTDGRDGWTDGRTDGRRDWGAGFVDAQTVAEGGKIWTRETVMTKSRSRSSSRSRRSGKSGSQEAIVLYGMASRSLRVSGGAIWLAEQTITSSEAGDKCPGLYYKSVWQLVLHALARCPGAFTPRDRR